MELNFNGVSAAYRTGSVVEDISFAVPTGSITALTGRNGAGKSTLISCLMGEKQDYRGTILLHGQDVRRMEPGQRARGIACLPQQLPAPHVTVRELVSFGRTPYTPLSGKLSPEDQEKIRWAMDAVGIGELQDSFVDLLSGGQRKKAFFAMILAQDTSVVVLDEPTAHLDAASRFEILELLEKMKKETGKTFLVVMHELPEILRCSDQIVTLSGRRLVFHGTPGECLEKQIPQRYFGIRITGDRENGYGSLPLRE